MINLDDVTKESIKEPNSNSEHPCRILVMGGSWSGKTNSLCDVANQQPGFDKIYLYTKHPYEVKYQFLINKRESTGSKHINDSKTFIEYSNDMDDICKNIEEYNPNKKQNINCFWLYHSWYA